MCFDEECVCSVVMDEDGLCNRNWGYYEPSSLRPNLGFQLIPGTIDRNEKPFLSVQNPNFNPQGYGDYTVSDAPFMSYSWLNQHRDSKFFSTLANPSHHHTLLFPETSRIRPRQLLQIPKSEEDMSLVKTEATESRKRQSSGGQKAPKMAKKEQKLKDKNVPRMQREQSPLKKKIEMVINGICIDIGGLPVPVCSCTGIPQPCYRWGCGGWQSACCTTNVSMYPLPMSTKRRGARIAGRKMSQGAFKKVLEKLSADGHDFSNPIDLKSHWARHGTNKFVTIR